MNSKKNNETTAVIVLANLMDAHGVLNEESRSRAAKAAQIFQTRNSDYLVTCGWAYRPDSDLPIAQAFSRYLINQFNIPPSAIIEELNSRDTVGDAVFTKIFLANHYQWQKIYVVTSDYHVARTREIFQFVYGGNFELEVIGAQADENEHTASNEVASLQAFRQTFLGVPMANDKAILERLTHAHPFYNGSKYPLCQFGH